MVVISYWDGSTRRGILAFRETDGSPIEALNDFDPIGPTEKGAITIVDTDYSSRTLAGWVRPDQLAELHGVDCDVAVIKSSFSMVR